MSGSSKQRHDATYNIVGALLSSVLRKRNSVAPAPGDTLENLEKKLSDLLDGGELSESGSSVPKKIEQSASVCLPENNSFAEGGGVAANEFSGGELRPVEAAASSCKAGVAEGGDITNEEKVAKMFEDEVVEHDGARSRSPSNPAAPRVRLKRAASPFDGSEDEDVDLLGESVPDPNAGCS